MSSPSTTLVNIRPYPQIVITGDSVAYQSFRGAGYGVRLVGQYNGVMDVLNRGLPGYVFNGLQTIPLDQFANNLRLIFRLIRRCHPAAAIIYITPAQCIVPLSNAMNKKIGMTDQLVNLLLRDNDNTLRYVEKAKEICHMENVPCVDPWSEFENAMIKGVPAERLLPDGLHWSASAFSLVNKVLFDIIRTSFPHLSPESQPLPFQSFAELCHEEDRAWDPLRSKLPEIWSKLATLQAELWPKFSR